MSEIRRARDGDIERIDALLYQVHGIHAAGRPDLFRPGQKKYSDDELRLLIADDLKPVYVYTDDDGVLQGYAFCVYQETAGDASRYPHRTLYIDDLCVDASSRGQHVGRQLCCHVRDVARENGCDDVTLNVWELNSTARSFYDAMGFTPLKTVMEYRL